MGTLQFLRFSLLRFPRTLLGMMVLFGLIILACCSTMEKKEISHPLSPLATLKQAEPSIIPDFLHLPDQPNPLISKVDLYLHLLTSSGKDSASASMYAIFMKENPSWPNKPLMQRKFETALAAEKDDAIASPLCQNNILKQTASYLRCSRIPAVFMTLARKIHAHWQNDIFSAQDEAALLNLFKNYLSEEDYWRRFLLFEKNNALYAAQRQITHLTQEQKPLARAILAFHADDPQAENFLHYLQPRQTFYPELILNNLRWLRRSNHLEEAVKLWKEKGLLAESTSQSPEFWTERRILAFALVNRRHLEEASFISNDPACPTAHTCEDAAFLSGWISLQFLNKPADAIKFFTRQTNAISLDNKAKGFYWLGRAYQKAKNASSMQASWEAASHYPTTFYGQLALVSLDKNQTLLQNYFNSPQLLKAIIQKSLTQLTPPQWSEQQGIDYVSQELTRAGILLVLRNDMQHAKAFFLEKSSLDATPAYKAMAAFFLQYLQIHDISIQHARSALRSGVELYPYGWTTPYLPLLIPFNHPALILAIIRQESSFNPAIASPAGAVGLMQLLPNTAYEIAQKNHIKISAPIQYGLISPNTNIQLGNAYAESLFDQFNGVYPYMIASYNAGPNKVKKWVDTNDQHLSTSEMIDWIETIPYAETRHYVQHVWENMLIYQTLIHHTPSPS